MLILRYFHVSVNLKYFPSVHPPLNVIYVKLIVSDQMI